MKRRPFEILLTVMAILITAALAGISQGTLRSDPGETVSVTITEKAKAGGAIEQEAGLSEGGAGAVSVGQAPPPKQSPGGPAADPYCATNSNPEQGFTESTLKWGTIIPLTGALRPLGEQTARVMKVASEVWMNSIPFIPGPYSSVKWGCSTRPGIFGRKVSLTIFSLNANTDTEAKTGMYRLIEQEKVFLVRDCYLESNLMGSATEYQNQQGVPGIWCSYSGMPIPALARWNFSPGTDPLKLTAIHTGWLINKEGKTKLAILADPTAVNDTVAVARRVAANLGHPIPDSCVQTKKAQDAPSGERSEITALRGCYDGSSPDALIAFDALNGVFGPMEAQAQGWEVQWACLTCWVQTLAELCGSACKNMITDCQALPCIPWADFNAFPAARELETTRQRYLPKDPADILTYGPEAITGGLGLWLGMTGPNLSRASFRATFETKIKNWDAGIGPTLTISGDDHYGGKSVWLIKFCGSAACDPEGRNPWFQDLTGNIHPDGNGFVPLAEVGVREEWTINR